MFLALGPTVDAGIYNAPSNHYGLLRTLETGYGVPLLAGAQTASTIDEIWSPHGSGPGSWRRAVRGRAGRLPTKRAQLRTCDTQGWYHPAGAGTVGKSARREPPRLGRQRGGHEQAPDGRRVAAAERLGAADRRDHRFLALREAHPDAGRQRRRVAAEPGVEVRLDRAGLAGLGPGGRQLRAAARAEAEPAGDVVLQDRRHLRRRPRRDGPPPGVGGRRRDVVHLAEALRICVTASGRW